MILHMCSARIYGTGKTFRGSPCSKPAKVERDGKHYCTFHDPERVNARRAAKRAAMQARATARLAERDAEQARNNEIARRAECYQDLLAALQSSRELNAWAMECFGFDADLSGTDAAIAKATGAQA